MSLHIDRISLYQFRGYESFVLENLGQLVVFVGPNAVGKTNIVEALQLLTSGESFRKPSWPELVSWGSDTCRVSADLIGDKRRLEHEMRVVDGKRECYVNGKKKSAAAFRGECPSVLFIPDDLQMVKASSARRRDALDALALQLSSQYSSLRSEYTKTLKQRNLLLREELAQGPLFESWNESLVIHGSRLFLNRFRLFNRLREHMRRIYQTVIPNESFDMAYIPSWCRFDEEGRQLPDIPEISDVPDVEDVDLKGVQDTMARMLVRLLPTERQRKTSLVGPHKDEISFFIEGRNARRFASQGQQRTVVLVEKLAEVELVREMTGQEPILLLDDVMSELDAAHRDALTSFVEQSAQTFVTTTGFEVFSADLLDRAQIVCLPLE